MELGPGAVPQAGMERACGPSMQAFNLQYALRPVVTAFAVCPYSVISAF